MRSNSEAFLRRAQHGGQMPVGLSRPSSGYTSIGGFVFLGSRAMRPWGRRAVPRMGAKAAVRSMAEVRSDGNRGQDSAAGAQIQRRDERDPTPGAGRER